MQGTRDRVVDQQKPVARGLARLGGLQNLALLALRAVIGIVMAYHGWQKITGGISNFAGFIETLNVPFPDLMAYVVTALELGGGILLIIGLLTRVWALLIATEMVFTTLLVKLDIGLIAPEGAGAELDLLILAGCLIVLILGPGAFSADRALGIEPAP
ncbi:DoxX family protein [soil metagenome]|nr:DoxX family protein [Actinomycetota bacterium]